MTREECEKYEHLSTLLRYNPLTGRLSWVVDRLPGARRNDTAGTLTEAGYIKVVLFRKDFKAHRLAWILHHKVALPKNIVIDHVNGNASDNRISNLRACSQRENSRNSKRPKNNKSGYKGVSLQGSRFRAYICVERRQIHLGRFDTAEEAYSAYVKAAQKYFGEFAKFKR